MQDPQMQDTNDTVGIIATAAGCVAGPKLSHRLEHSEFPIDGYTDGDVPMFKRLEGTSEHVDGLILLSSQT